ncbi:MAG: oligosaccharide flippase family protein [Bacteroidales bacterium]|nr:oligosaccharide flippase family protein [Bacteroidales bacterium]
MKGFFKDIIKISGSNTLAAVINVLIGVIITRSLGPEGRGIYAAILIVPGLVIRFAELGIRRSVIYHIGKANFEDAQIVYSLLVTVAGTIILGIFISLGFYFFLDNPEFTIPLIVIAVVRIPLQLIRRYAGGFLMGKQMYNSSIYLRWSFLGIYLLSTVIFLIIFKMGVMGALLALVSSNLLISIYIVFLVKSQIGKLGHFNAKSMWEMLKFGLLYSATTFVMMLHLKVDILILGKLSTFEQIGFYSLATAIAGNWQIPFSVGGVIISSSANEQDEQIKNKNISKFARISFLIGLLSYIALYFLAPFLIEFLYGKEFIPSIELLRYIMPAILLLIIARILASRLAGEGKPYIFMFIALPALFLNIILNYIWIPKYDAMGAVYATNVSYGILCTVGLFVYLKEVNSTLKEFIVYRKSDFDFIPIALKELKKRYRKVVRRIK